MSDSVLTLVRPEKQGDFSEILASVYKSDKWSILAQGRAAHVRVDQPIAVESIAQWRDQFQADIFVQPAKDHGVKKLLLADMDSTIVTTETLDEIAGALGLKDKVAAITEASMRGELDFTGSIDARVAMIKGLHKQALDDTAKVTVLSPGAATLIATLRKRGTYCVLVSGGFTYFTRLIAEQCGFDAHHGNRLEFEGDHLTGQVLRPVLDKNAKATIMHDYCQTLTITPEQVTTIGDGANDRAMIQAAGLGVGYYPKPKLAACTAHQIWHNDLTALLFAQGIKESEFVNG